MFEDCYSIFTYKKQAKIVEVFEMQLYQNLHVRNDGFLVKNDGTVVVYTDGACRNNNRKDDRHSGSGIFWGDHRRSLSVPFPKHGAAENTNQYAEARAILYAAR